jgi:hypothetical protein
MEASGIGAGEVPRVVADSDKIVADPATGVLRQVVAGQVIPPHLVEADEADESVVDDAFEGPWEAPEATPTPAASKPAAAAAGKPGGGKTS